MEIRISQFLFKYHITLQSTTGISRVFLARVQDGFIVGEKVNARNFNGPERIAGRVVND